ncbi:hypothetical protein BBBOND_0200750 [Babesia bigemina]|uniref:Uncharacterized protein n=1 Tax=Babesia bigemina TaxID=5866 RepID=A0A061D2T3_BABBI|nr:hypothetical protein BBBOND_0200750 [Babesia bigemina]CDR94918.1 hypothetical protein BBBOND_0200750 [Babesia bigemina]|eukprot:XP_012767104.1 hypothetical protein BBBOND_0200750 [Babesia bigemina]
MENSDILVNPLAACSNEEVSISNENSISRSVKPNVSNVPKAEGRPFAQRFTRCSTGITRLIAGGCNRENHSVKRGVVTWITNQ